MKKVTSGVLEGAERNQHRETLHGVRLLLFADESRHHIAGVTKPHTLPPPEPAATGLVYIVKAIQTVVLT